MSESCDLDEDVELSGHFNDGMEIDEFTARRIAKTLFSLLNDGTVATYERAHDVLLKALPDEECKHCNGTGVRDDEYVQGKCNGCNGTGKVRPFETWYSFSEENVQKFAEFARLEYPISVLRGVCTYMAAVTAEYEWIKVRERVSTWA